MAFVVLLISLYLMTSPSDVQGAGPEYLSLYYRLAQYHLRTFPQRVLENITTESCARACVMETDFECKSFDYDNVNTDCHLHNHTHTEPLVGLQESQTTDHYRTAYEKLFNRIPNHVITMRHNRKIFGLSIEECARRCILEISFKCTGFDYEISRKNCWLTDKLPHDVGGLTKRPLTDYYERKTNGPLSRFINYGYGSLQTLEGVQTHTKIVLGVNLDACAQLCLAETSFKCASFDFVFGEQSCQLSQYIAANVHGLRTEFESRYSVMHYELIYEHLDFFYPTPYASVLGNNERTFLKVTPDTCARKCLEEREFVCRSFDYQIQKGTCLLSHVTGSDAGGLYTPEGGHVHHFEMKTSLDCGDNLIGDRGIISSPNWPRHYRHHLNCTWSVTVPVFKIVRIDILHLDLGVQSDDPCDVTNDVLSFTERVGADKHVRCVENYQKELSSFTNTLNVTFVTNAENDAQGFRLVFTADWPCQTDLTSDNGEFASPRWPNTYPAMSSCSWTLRAPMLSNIELRFNSVELEDHTGSACNTAYDKIAIYDGESTSSERMAILCGNTRPITFVSSGHTLYVEFTSDSRVQANGFHASYRFLYSTTTTIITTTTTATTTTQPPSTTTTTVSPFYNDSVKLNNSLQQEGLSEQQNTSGKAPYTRDGRKNNSVSVSMAMTGEDDDTKDIVELVATFVEPTVVILNESEVGNQTKHDIRVVKTGDDIGMAKVPEITFDIVPSDKTYTTIIWGITLAILLMFLVMVISLVLVCRHYRRRVPKIRQGSNMENAEENMSLCQNGRMTSDREEIYPDEGDIDEAARLPLPSDHEATPDVEFMNPLYKSRQSVMYTSSTCTSTSDVTRDVSINEVQHSDVGRQLSSDNMSVQESINHRDATAGFNSADDRSRNGIHLSDFFTSV